MRSAKQWRQSKVIFGEIDRGAEETNEARSAEGKGLRGCEHLSYPEIFWNCIQICTFWCFLARFFGRGEKILSPIIFYWGRRSPPRPPGSPSLQSAVKNIIHTVCLCLCTGGRRGSWAGVTRVDCVTWRQVDIWLLRLTIRWWRFITTLPPRKRPHSSSESQRYVQWIVMKADFGLKL